MLGLLALAMGGVLAGSLFLPDNEDDQATEAQSSPDSIDNEETNPLDTGLLDDTGGPEVPLVLRDLSSDIHLTDDVDRQIILDVPSDGDAPFGYTNIVGSSATFVVEEGDLSRVDLGDGNNHVDVRGGAAVIVTGEGQDTVDASGLVAGEIHAGAGDIVYGSNVGSGASGPAALAVNAHGAEFYGGDANELAVATGDGALLDGGGGNDQLAAFEGNAVLRGGDGDDWLIGNASSDHFDQNSRVSDINSVTNMSSDTLDGGDGDDHLLLSNGDVGVGGSGADTFEAYHSADGLPSAAHILDFSPSEDALLVYVGGGMPDSPDDESYDLSDRVGVSDLDAGTEIVVDGTVVATIDGVTELRVGIPIVASEGGDSESGGQFVDAVTGEIADIDAFDVIVKVYQARSS